MAAKRKLVLELVADADKFERDLKKSDRALTRFSRGVERKAPKGGLLGALMSGRGLAAGGAAAGGAVAFSFLKDSVDAAKEAEKAATQLAVAYRAVGVSAAQVGDDVDASITKLSKLSAFDDEALTAGFTKLLRTTGSVAKAQKDLALATDIARARNISLEAAIKIVEKAETGRLLGLKNLGIAVDANTSKQEALRLANEKFAGSAEAYGNTAAGAQERLSVAFENLQEKIGKRLLPVLTDVVVFLAAAADNADKLLTNLEKIADLKIPLLDSKLGNLLLDVAKHVGPVGVANAVKEQFFDKDQFQIFVELDGEQIAKKITIHQQRKDARNPHGRRG